MPSEPPEPPQYSIASVDNALQIALMLMNDRSLRISELAATLGIARSTAHRLLAMLVYRGFAVQDEFRTYRAGPAIQRDGTEERQRDLRSVARRHLERLRSTYDETVHLMVLRGPQVLFLESVEGAQALKIGSRAGAVMPAHVSSGGKTLLADLSTPALRALYADSAAADKPEFEQLERTLTATRRRGYGLNLGEAERGIHAIGAAVHEPAGRAVAAISLSLPSLRLPRRRIAELAASVLATAAAIDADLTG
ncbi:IclR family transcriptional regulator [Antrihabitans sp. YC2-6]|uniref:IclR family transcriptional regulator n=1 Tax=Antrihabitans sp. YC2-6 TaxID=2799498 RepID=UPI0018F70D63|nr:IclR family transcriptional regulator [Antrihabitans sp. YC2-6]MBJ8348259.1 IclR family transcriptional regulator [Antrihabitans sp. YC2-6]